MNQKQMLDGFLEALATAAEIDVVNAIDEFSEDLKSEIMTFLVGFVDYLEQHNIQVSHITAGQFGRLCYTTQGKQPRITVFSMLGQQEIQNALSHYSNGPFRFHDLHQHLRDNGDGIDLTFIPESGIASSKEREALYTEYFYDNINHS
jgi:hypothetical protein